MSYVLDVAKKMYGVQLTSRPIDPPMVGWLVDCSVARLLGRSVVCLVGWLVWFLVGPLLVVVVSLASIHMACKLAALSLCHLLPRLHPLVLPLVLQPILRRTVVSSNYLVSVPLVFTAYMPTFAAWRFPNHTHKIDR